MGSDKGLVYFKNKFLIEHILESLGSNCIGIVSNSDEYKQFIKPVWPDIYKDCGPLGGIHSALYHSNVDWNFIVGCDLPYITSKFYFFLLNQIKTHQGKTRVPIHDHKAEPLCALYHRSCITEIEKLLVKKELKMMDALEKLETSYIELPKEFDADVLFRNINSPEDTKN